MLAVATAAYLAAVYLAADAARIGRPDLARAFRVRALATAVVAGAIAARRAGRRARATPSASWTASRAARGSPRVLVSARRGVATLALVARAPLRAGALDRRGGGRRDRRRLGLAQRPSVLPGLTIQEAAAGRSTLVAMLVGLGARRADPGPVARPALLLLLRGRFDEEPAPRKRKTGPVRAHPAPRLLPAAGVCLVVGVVATFAFDSGWGQVVGVPALLAFIALGSVALVTATAEKV